MPKIHEQVVLRCSREKAFTEMAAVDFVKRIDPNAGIEFETTFESERFTRYKMKVGKWEIESEKVIIPEAFTFLTRRTISSPAGYFVIIQIFENHETETLLKHIEDFEPAGSEAQLSDLKSKVRQYLQKVQSYFGAG